METSQTVGALFAALAKAQAEIKNAKRDSENPHFKYSYADLAAVWDVCRGPLSKNGLSIIQSPFNDGEFVGITTILGHSSGEWVKNSLKTRPSKIDPQSIGSAISYFRRYSLMAIAGVAADDDDDGEKAMDRSYQTPLDRMPTPNSNPKSSPKPNVQPITPLKEEQSSKPILLKNVWSKLKLDLQKSDEEAKAHLIKITGKKSTDEMTVDDLQKAYSELKNMVDLKNLEDVPLGI